MNITTLMRKVEVPTFSLFHEQGENSDTIRHGMFIFPPMKPLQAQTGRAQYMSAGALGTVVLGGLYWLGALPWLWRMSAAWVAGGWLGIGLAAFVWLSLLGAVAFVSMFAVMVPHEVMHERKHRAAPLEPAQTYNCRHVFTNRGEYRYYIDDTEIFYLPVSAIVSFEVRECAGLNEPIRRGHPVSDYDKARAAITWDLCAFMGDGSSLLLGSASGWGADVQARILSALKSAHADAMRATKTDKATLERMGRAWLDLRNPAAPAERRAAAETELNNGAASLGWATA